MTRRLLFLLIGLLLPATATAGVGSPPDTLKTMVFQNGVSPTSGYSGIADTFITSATADSNKNFGASDSLMLAGEQANDGKVREILLKWDPGTTLSGKVVASVKVYLYQNGGEYLGGDPGWTRVYLLARPWVEGTKRGGNQVGSADWRDAGKTRWKLQAGPTLGDPREGYAAKIHWGSRQVSNTDTSVTSPTWTGTDSLDYSKQDISAFDQGGVWPIATFTPKEPIHFSPTPVYEDHGWIGIEFQPSAWRSLIGATAGFSVVIKYGEPPWYEDVSQSNIFSFRSSNFAQKAYRPKVVVQYYEPYNKALCARCPEGAAPPTLGISGGLGLRR